LSREPRETDDSRSDSSRSQFLVSVCCLALLALVLRLALFAIGPWHGAERSLRPDSARYVLLAHNLLRYHAFGKSEEDGLMHLAVARLRAGNGTEPRRDANGLMPESFRTPGYPAFLAAIFAVVDDVRVALLVQCVTGSAGTVLVVFIATSIGLTRRAALVAGLLWAIHPALVLYDNLVLTESFFNFTGLIALTVACRSTRLSGSLLAGVVLGLTGLVRPVGLLYLPAALACGWGRQARQYLAAACLITSAVLPSALWAFRNREAGEGIRVSSVGDLNLLFYSAAFMVSEERGEDWLTSWPRRVEEMEAKLAGRLAPGEDVVSAARRIALLEMMAKPRLAAKVHAKSELKLLVDHSAGEVALLLDKPYHPTGLFSRLVLGGRQKSEESRTFQVAAVASWALLNASILLAAVVGCVLAVRRRAIRLLFVCVPTIVLFVVATGCVGLERFRLPLMLPLFLLAASVCGVRINALGSRPAEKVGV
jgi:hypothetical protein